MDNISLETYKDEQGVQYTKQKLFESLVFFAENSGMGFGGYGDFNFTPLGPCPFKGKSTDEKLKMCGFNGSWNPQEALDRGLITDVSIPCSPGRIKFNKAAADDLVAILTEIKGLGFFKCNITSAFRTEVTAKGHSRHQIGLAVDINGGRGGNPWFNHRFSRSEGEPQSGFIAPWGRNPQYTKGGMYSGGYDRSICIWSYDHPVVKIFEGHGWGWGGYYGDVMHFSITNGS